MRADLTDLNPGHPYEMGSPLSPIPKLFPKSSIVMNSHSSDSLCEPIKSWCCFLAIFESLADRRGAVNKQRMMIIDW